MVSLELEGDDIWRTVRALQRWGNYLDKVYEDDKSVGDAYRDIAKRLIKLSPLIAENA